MKRKNETPGNIPSAKKHSLKFRKNLGAWVLLLPVVLVLYLMIWRPTVMGGVLSFYKMKGYTATEFIGLKNYKEVLHDTLFLQTLKNTFMYVVWSLIIGYLPPMLIAVLINEMVHFKNGFKIMVYLPAIIPGVAAMLMWSYIYDPGETGLLNMVLIKLGFAKYGWLNDANFTILYLIIYMTWHGFAGTVILYLSSLQSVQVELYEAAAIDGAGMFGRFRYITIPQISGILLLNLVSQIKGVFQVMEEPMVMTGGGPSNASMSLSYQLYKYAFLNGKTGHAMALGVIIFLILMVVTVFYFRLQKKVEDNY